jgi:GNAT superfamily N-acetyltransferase
MTKDIRVEVLAERPEFAAALGMLRWSEWGAGPGREQPADSVEVTRQEAGHVGLPATFVALEAAELVGGVGLARQDLASWSKVSPWIVGMVVRPNRRRRGVGRMLLTRLEQWAVSLGVDRVWVAAAWSAVDFYRACGWRIEQVIGPPGSDPAVVLVKDATG